MRNSARALATHHWCRRRRIRGVLLFFILLGAVPFLLPIVTFVSLFSVRQRLSAAEAMLEQQQRALDELTTTLRDRKSVV